MANVRLQVSSEKCLFILRLKKDGMLLHHLVNNEITQLNLSPGNYEVEWSVKGIAGASFSLDVNVPEGFHHLIQKNMYADGSEKGEFIVEVEQVTDDR